MLPRLNHALSTRYHVERELGRGGMATVWLATEVRTEHRVAIKVLQPALAGAIGADRFTREVKLTATIQHPSILPVLDSGVIPTDGDGPPLPWYTMSYIEGESLRAKLERERQLSIDDALRITTDVAAALQVAHGQGVVHRDIKPENVLLAGPHVYVVDFGIAKALVETGGDRLTSTGIAIGTPAYMSPEQASAEPVDARSDQYSLATMLYEMLVGEPPFTGPTAQAVVARRFAEPARPIRTVRSTVPESVEHAVLTALERAPADRYPDVASFAAALRRGSLPARRRTLGVRRVTVPIVAGAALVIAAVAAGSWRAWTRHVAIAPARDSTVVALLERGLGGYDLRTPAGSREAVAALSEAVRRDSTYLPAWSALGRTYIRMYERAFDLPGVTPDSMLRLAVLAAERALALDPNSADAWGTQAIVSRHIDPTDRTQPLRAARRAIALDSTNAVTWHHLAIDLMETGDFEGAMRAWRRCVQLNPRYTQGLVFLGLGHMWHRSYDSAVVWTDSAIAVDPNYLFGWQAQGEIEVERASFTRASAAYAAAARISTDVERVTSMAGLAAAEASAGHTTRARALLRQVDSLASAFTPVPLHTVVYVAHAYAALHDTASAMHWLDGFALPADLHFQLHLRCDPSFDPIAADPRFRAMLLRERPPAERGCR
jgi:cytochrome c-type biogenesis protein CcmH/NrfG/tRNA A-37 threonylcarbamoyl transferase component Bud32